MGITLSGTTLTFNDGTTATTSEPAVGTVGSYLLGRTLINGPLDQGANYSGLNLASCDCEGYPRYDGSYIVVQGGTWRTMGITVSAGTTTLASRPNQSTLFLRIA